MQGPDPRAQIVSLLPRLRRFALGLTGDPHQADDLVQAGCLKALERWSQWQPGTQLASWLFRILQTTWIDEVRARQRQQTDTDTEALDAVIGEDGQQIVEARSDMRTVRQAMATLPPEQQAVLMMVTVEGMSYRQVADALEVPVGTVMSRLARARGKLADALGRTGVQR